MPNPEFKICLKENLFSQVDETVSYFAEVRRYLYHFLCLYMGNKTNYNGYTKKYGYKALNMNDRSLLFIYCFSLKTYFKCFITFIHS